MLAVGKLVLLFGLIAAALATDHHNHPHDYNEQVVEESLYEPADIVDAFGDQEQVYEVTDDVLTDDLEQHYEQDSPDQIKKAYERYTYEHVPQAYVERRGYQRQPRSTPRPPAAHYPPSSPPFSPTPIPVHEPCYTEEEVHDHPHAHIGSIPGRPGIDFPIYTEIPLTDFSCDGRHSPGFYADVETRCQVFHMCYPHRRESFLCPVGTVFNQPILSCDYWYSANCSAAEKYFEEILPTDEPEVVEPVTDYFPTTVKEVHTVVPEVPIPVIKIVKPIIKLPPVKPVVPMPPAPEEPVISFVKPIVSAPPSVSGPVVSQDAVLSLISQFLPIKAKVVTTFTAPLAMPMKVKAKKVLAAAAVKPKIIAAAKAKVIPMPYKVPVYRPKVVIPVVKPVPVSFLVKAALAPTVKTAVSGTKILLGKPKLSAPLVKPLLLKKVVAAKKVKAAAIPISLFTKKHLTASALKMVKGHQKLQYVPSALHQ